MGLTLADLARSLNGRVRGDAAHRITGVATLERAGAGDLAFVADPKYREQLQSTAAGVVLLRAADADGYNGNAVVVDDPQLCFARAAALLHPLAVAFPGVHPAAVVEAGARVAPSAQVGAHALIETGATVAEHVVIGPGCVVGRDATVGARSRLVARVVVAAGCVIGSECIVHPGAVIGGDGFGFAKDGESWVKMPQLGRAVLGNQVEVGANTTIDRGTLGDTVIEDGVKLDNLIQVAHNVRIGAHTAIAACTGIAGSTVIGRRCAIGGQVGIAGHLHVADDVQIMAQSLVTSSIAHPGAYASSIKAEPLEQWRRNAARVHQLDELARRLRQLEQKMKVLIGEQET
jgi:UDP-3-O-[3-hydroxymyristoyl] glucosamine N-acyltransferase